MQGKADMKQLNLLTTRFTDKQIHQRLEKFIDITRYPFLINSLSPLLLEEYCSDTPNEQAYYIDRGNLSSTSWPKYDVYWSLSPLGSYRQLIPLLVSDYQSGLWQRSL